MNAIVCRSMTKPCTIFKTDAKLSKVLNFYYEKNYNNSKYVGEQNILFKKLNFDREKALIKLNKIKQNYDFLMTPMSSEHQTIFSSIWLCSTII